jgi:hypothetical protein
MATQPFCTDAPGTDERYEAASNTSNLTVSASFGMVGMDEATPKGDTILAAGLVASNRAIGMALLRLHSEWTSSAKPRHVERQVIDRLAEGIKEQDRRDRATAARTNKPYTAPGPAWDRANEMAHGWYVSEFRLLATRLRTRREAIDKLTAWGLSKGISPLVVSAALHHWLDSVCQECGGLGLRYLENLAIRQCGKCHGSGKTPTPEGAGRVLNAMDDMINDARGSLGRRLRDMR